MSEATVRAENRVNGIDVDALHNVIQQIGEDPAKGIVEFRVKSQWAGQARSEASVESYTIGGQTIRRSFKVAVDEPFELLGENTAPNPQELLLTALNACVMVGYVAGAAARGIKLEKVEIETKGELDLRLFSYRDLTPLKNGQTVDTQRNQSGAVGGEVDHSKLPRVERGDPGYGQQEGDGQEQGSAEGHARPRHERGRHAAINRHLDKEVRHAPDDAHREEQQPASA